MNTAIIEVERLGLSSKEEYKVKTGTVFKDWLESNVFHEDVKIRVNRKWLRDDDDIDFKLKPNDFIQIFDRPKNGTIGTILNPLEHLNPIKFTQKILSEFMPNPNASLPNAASKTSSNNSLKSQTNIARNGEARPDNYGQVRAFPDLLQQSAFEYINNEKHITELLNFGIGKYDVSSIRYSESNLGYMEGATSEIYQAGAVIPNINEVYLFDDVDGQELLGPNESDEVPKQTASANQIVSGEIAGGEVKVTIVKQDEFDYFFDLLKPHDVTVELSVTYKTPQKEVTENIKVSAVLYLAEESDDGSLIDPEYYQTFYFRDITGLNIPADSKVNTTRFILNDNQLLTVGPFFSPVEGEQLWVHMNANLDSGGRAKFNIRYWKVDDENSEIDGTRKSHNDELISDGKMDIYGKTIKLPLDFGVGRYAVQLTRTDNSSDQNTLKVEACHMVFVREFVVYKNDTVAKVSVKQTKNATRNRERKYNALITRHVISYDTALRKVDYQIKPSRRFADAVIHSWIVIGKQPESTIDIHGLYMIQAEIEEIDSRLGRVDYTFDDENVSLGSRISTLCDAANVIAFWDNGVLSFTLDKKRERAVTILNSSNLTNDSFNLSYSMTLPGGFDGVEVEFRNPITNKQDYVRYRVTENGIEQSEALKPKKFSMLYIRDRFQADFRAMRECKRLIHSNISAKVASLADGEWLNVGDLIKLADIMDVNQQSGSITHRESNRFETSERIKFTDDMYVVITDEIGNATESYPASPLDDTDFGFSADIPNINLAIYDGYNVQSPSRYIIATKVELDEMSFVITEKKTSGNKTAITLAEYSDLIYQ